MPVQSVIAHGKNKMIKRINPVAKAIALSRRKTATQVVPDKKKYNRKKAKEQFNAEQKNDK